MFNQANIKAGISSRDFGNMKFSEDIIDKSIIKNRQVFFEKVGIDFNSVVAAGLEQGDNIAIVNQEDRGGFIKNVDGLATCESNICLTVTVADCQPIFYFDPKKQVIALVHAGWRGVGKNIEAKMVGVLEKEFGSDPEDILVIIGPRLRDCHFEVKDDLRNIFSNYPKAFREDNNKTYLNLSQISIKHLEMAGTKRSNIQVSQDCTYCLEKKYYSYRRDKPEKIEAAAAYIMLV